MTHRRAVLLALLALPTGLMGAGCIETAVLGTIPPDASEPDVPHLTPDAPSVDAGGAADSASSCLSNKDCEDGGEGGAFCFKPEAHCEARGVCIARPISCPPTDAAVCTCSLTMAASRCEAELSGMSVFGPGLCPPQPKTDGGMKADGLP